jgi:hypothetical protein
MITWMPMTQNDLYLVAAKDGTAVRILDTVELTDGTHTVLRGMTGNLIEHSGGFCHAEKIAKLVSRPELVPATLLVNSAHVTNNKPDGVFYTLRFPIHLTGQTKMIDGARGNTLHYEAVVNGKLHWIDRYAIVN